MKLREVLYECEAHHCMFLEEVECESPATKVMQIFPYAGGDWVTLRMCDKHYAEYQRMADRIPGLQVKF